jgi:hypothetical protein
MLLARYVLMLCREFSKSWVSLAGLGSSMSDMLLRCYVVFFNPSVQACGVSSVSGHVRYGDVL